MKGSCGSYISKTWDLSIDVFVNLWNHPLQTRHYYSSNTEQSVSSIFHALYFHRYHPMAASPHNRRIQPKSLNIDDSGASSPENKYLSPALSILSMMSPPPRPQSEDYFGSKRGKKRRQSRLKRPCPTPILRSEDTGSGEASFGHDAGVDSSKGDNGESYDHSDDAGLLKETAQSDHPPLLSIVARGQDGTGSWTKHGGHKSTAPYRSTFIEDSSSNQDDSFDFDDSPAVNSLRRISRSMTQSSDSKRREFKYLSKLLTDKINTIFRSKGKSPFGDFDENTDRSNIFGFHRASTDPSTFGENASGDLSPTSKVSIAQVARLRNPALITLRKASGVNPLSSTANAGNLTNASSNIMQNSQQPLSSTTISNLVSFQSQPKDQAAKSAWEQESKLEKRPASPASRSSYDATPHARARFMSLSHLGNSGKSQQFTSPAEPALTVTSFYPTRAASSKPQSRSHSLSLERAPFRFSIVQIVSRKSIHEVIWYEDDTSTSDDSMSPISPKNELQARGGSVPRVVVDSGGQETPLIAITTSPTEISASPQVKENASTDSLIDPTNAHKRLLSWSWDNPRPSIADIPGSSQEGNEAPELRERTSSVSMRSNFSMRRAATADILAAGYSPHLTWEDSMPAEGDVNDESTLKTSTGKKKRDTLDHFDRGMDMFQRRGVSVGSGTGSQVAGEKNGDQSGGLPSRVNTK